MSGNEDKKLPRADFRGCSDFSSLTDLGSRFHNLAPRTANELLYAVLTDRCALLNKFGTIAFIPRLG